MFNINAQNTPSSEVKIILGKVFTVVLIAIRDEKTGATSEKLNPGS